MGRYKFKALGDGATPLPQKWVRRAGMEERRGGQGLGTGRGLGNVWRKEFDSPGLGSARSPPALCPWASRLSPYLIRPVKIRPAHHQAAVRLTCDPAGQARHNFWHDGCSFFFSLQLLFLEPGNTLHSPLPTPGAGGVLHSSSEVGGRQLDTDFSSRRTAFPATASQIGLEGKIIPFQGLLPSVCPELIVSWTLCFQQSLNLTSPCKVETSILQINTKGLREVP